MSRATAIARAQAYFDGGDFLADLTRRVAIPSTSQEPERASALRAYLTDEIVPALTRLGFTCCILDNANGPPVLAAERSENPAFVTALLYGHGDTVRGQDKQWQDPLAFIALGIGIVCTIAFPILMATRPYPLVPLRLFRSREFSVINLSTLLIYGALYSTFGFLGLFLQGVLGYTAFAAGLIGLPSGVLLTVLSTRVGTTAARVGARPFLVIGPVLMGIGLLWYLRVQPTSEPWQAVLGQPSTLIPPVDTIVDILPAVLLFGTGISLVVAPLTTTLMGSVPVGNAGIASAINNAISRVGQPLLAAVLFIVISGTFYAQLAASVPGLDPNSAEVRRDVPPMNPPAKTVPPEVAEASKVASTDAFHLAAIVGAVLLFAGAGVNWFGLRARAPGTAAQPNAPPEVA